MVEDEPGQDARPLADARLDDLEQRLRKAQQTEAVRIGKAPTTDANEAMGQKVLSLLIGGVLGGALIGWVLDRVFGTSPKLLIVMAVLGTAGGFWSIVKIANRPTGNG